MFHLRFFESLNGKDFARECLFQIIFGDFRESKVVKLQACQNSLKIPISTHPIMQCERFKYYKMYSSLKRVSNIMHVIYF